MTNLKACCLGIVVLIITNTVWFSFLQIEKYSEVLILLLWTSPFVAGFLVSYLAPSKNLFLGTLMAIIAAILVVTFNSVYQILGNTVDFPGFRGGAILFAMTLVSASIFAIPGSIIGTFLSKRKSKNKQIK
jgi:hypothetical protein